MGCVYRALDTRLDRVVALKIIIEQGNFLNFHRFEREAKVLASLNHPNIVPVLDFGTFADGRRFMAMPFIEGDTLDRWIKTQQDEVAASVRVVLRLSKALAYLHSKEVIHRDLKPQNVIISRETGEPILLDFGLARPDGISLEKLTASGVVLGTYNYMPPEQANGAKVDARADVYGLGAILYHCLCGRPPIVSGAGHYMMMKQIFEETPPNPSSFDDTIPHSLNEFCLRTLSKSPRLRPQSSEEFTIELERAWSSRGTAPGKNLKKIGAVIVLLILLIATVGALAVSLQEEPVAPEDPVLTLSNGIPDLKVLEGERLLGAIGADGTLTLRLSAGPKKLSIVRETGERYETTVSLMRDQKLPLKLTPRGLVTLSANQKIRVTIRNSAGKVARDEEGKEISQRTLPFSNELVFGTYTVEGMVRSQVKKERRRFRRSLVVKPGATLEHKIPVGFQITSPLIKVWADPRVVDLNNDGVKDFVLVSRRRGNRGQSIAISGFDGRVLWLSSLDTVYWARPVLRSSINPPELVIADLKNNERRCVSLELKSGQELSAFRVPSGSQLQWHVGPVPFGEIDFAGGKKGFATAGHSAIWLVNQEGELASTLSLDRKIKFHLRSQMTPMITDLDRDGRKNDLILRLCDEVGDPKQETVTREIRAYRDIDRKQDPEAFQGFSYKSSRDVQFKVFEELGLIIIYSYQPESKEMKLQFVDARSFKEIKTATVRGSIVKFAAIARLKRIFVHSYFDRELRLENGAVDAKLTVFNVRGQKLHERMNPPNSRHLAPLWTPSGGSRLLILSPELINKRMTVGALVMISAENGYDEVWRSKSFKEDVRFVTTDLDLDGRSDIVIMSDGQLTVEMAPNK